MNNTAVLILKAAIDFNSEMMALASQVIAANSPVKMRTISRVIDRSVLKYQQQLKIIMEQDVNSEKSN